MEKASKNSVAAIEALLFAVCEALEPERIAAALDMEKKEVIKLCKHLMESYEESSMRGIRLIELDGKFQLCTKPEYFEELSKLVNIPKKHTLTDVLLETLSIVAYKQPITRQQIETIRGVSCSHAVNKLIEYHLIEEVGRLDAPGRPILFGTTEDFLRSFGISSMEDLPEISADKILDFQKQAEEEAGLVVVDT